MFNDCIKEKKIKIESFTIVCGMKPFLKTTHLLDWNLLVEKY